MVMADRFHNVNRNRISYADICKKDAIPGYVLDIAFPVIDMTIESATRKVQEKAMMCIEDLEEKRKRKIHRFYIGKSSLLKRASCQFNPNNADSWKLDTISSRYTHHCKEGRNCLIVLAVITKKSIPFDCYMSWYIVQKEEYALTLEKRVIQYNRKDPRLSNPHTYYPGGKSKKKTAAYVIYMAFAMEGKCGNELICATSSCMQISSET